MSFLTLGGFRGRRLAPLPMSWAYRFIAGSCFLFFLSYSIPAFSQAGYDIDLNKPPKFESKVLASEKSTSTKNTVLRRFVQGTVTHYNYYFNANQKILQVLSSARYAHRDDLTKLLPFYGYSLADTKAQSLQLDSVVYKCTAGIVLHDLRNGWIDNLYLLMGEAYFYEMKFDSADHALGFLNYQFYVKEKGDYHIPIGTATQSKNGQISVVNPENSSVGHRMFNRPPSRNDGLVFQVRSYTEQGRFTDASGLISLLKTDPIFPARLLPALYEQEAYLFYSEHLWDSAAAYLEKALPNAYNSQEQARWEFLLAQLDERVRHDQEAIAWYGKVIAHTTDPRLDIYARLNRALLAKGTSKEELPATIAELKKLAGRERFNPFRDVLYLSAARLALQIPDTAQTYQYLSLCVHSGGKADIKNEAYLMMASLGFAQSNYKIVARAYDSLQLGDPALRDSAAEFGKARTTYDKALVSILAVEREDSLQRIAAMPMPQREAYVKDLLRKLLRAQGLKENAAAFGTYMASRDSTGDLFAGQGGNGEWYFYNQVTLSQGAQEFNTRWGTRPNVDNWRKSASISLVGGSTIVQPTTEEGTNAKKPAEKAQALTVAAMMANLPVTPKQLDASNDTVAINLYRLGALYKDEIGDDRAAVDALEALHKRYPTYLEEPVLYDLYVSWHRLGNEEKAGYYLDLLHKRYPGGKILERLAARTAPPVKDTAAEAATERYKHIYDEFIAGNYDTALAEKQELDSMYGKKYWTPQLMYIQAVYYAHERQDSLAITALNQLIMQYPKDPLAPRAVRLRDVIHRRPMIETYLKNLQVERYKDDSTKSDSSLAARVDQDTALAGPPDLHRQRLSAPASLLESPASSQAMNLPGSGSIPAAGAAKGIHSDNYYFDPAAQHLVLMVMTQVATVYANEAKNAFNRYNSDVHYQENIPLDTVTWQPGVHILRFGPFKNIVDAIAYKIELEKKSGKEIIPWMTADKYRFLVISQDNLAVLRDKKKLDEYAAFIDSYLKDMPH